MRSIPTTFTTFLCMSLFVGACPMAIGAVLTSEGNMNVTMHEERRHGMATAMNQEKEEKDIPCEQCDDHVVDQTKLFTSAGEIERLVPVAPFAVLPAKFARIAQGSVITRLASAINAPPETAPLRTTVLRL